MTDIDCSPALIQLNYGKPKPNELAMAVREKIWTLWWNGDEKPAPDAIPQADGRYCKALWGTMLYHHRKPRTLIP